MVQGYFPGEKNKEMIRKSTAVCIYRLQFSFQVILGKSDVYHILALKLRFDPFAFAVSSM